MSVLDLREEKTGCIGSESESGEANSPPALMRKYAIVKPSHREASLAPARRRIHLESSMQRYWAPRRSTCTAASSKRSGTVLVCMFFLVECGMDGRWSRNCGGGGGVPSRISRSAMSYPMSSLLEWCICTVVDSYETRALSGRLDAG